MKKTWLYNLNYYFLQYFNVRLAKCIDSTANNYKYYHYSIMYGVKCYSGWDDNFKFINSMTEAKIIKISPIFRIKKVNNL